MQILLTNDDGIHAPGLKALRNELVRLGKVQVVAPESEQSGVGLATTYLHPLMVREERLAGEEFGWAVAGTPADCVKLGMLEFCKPRPDLVVSGINSGINAGFNVLYSGTVAAALEGAFFGVTSVAVSLSNEVEPDYCKSARSAVLLIEQLLEQGPEPGSLWNINFPANRDGWPLGVKTVALGVKRHVDVMEKRIDPRGRAYYWSGLDLLQNHPMDSGTDVRELADGYVTITPLGFDLTNESAVSRFRNVSWSLPE